MLKRLRAGRRFKAALLLVLPIVLCSAVAAQLSSKPRVLGTLRVCAPNVADISALSFSNDGKTLVVGTSKDWGRRHIPVQLWNVAARKKTLDVSLDVRQSGSSFDSVELSPDGSLIVGAAGQGFVVLNARTGRITNIGGDQAYAFTRSGSLLMVNGFDRRRIAHPAGREQETAEMKSKVPGVVEWRPDYTGTSKFLALKIPPNYFKGQSDVPKEVPATPPWLLASILSDWYLSSDGQRGAICLWGQTPMGPRYRSTSAGVLIFDIRSGHDLHVLPLIKTLPFSGLMFSPDHRLMAIDSWVARGSNDGFYTTQVWDVQASRSLWDGSKMALGHPHFFSPDGKTLVCEDANGTAQLHDARTGRFLATLERGGRMFSPDSTFLAGSDTGSRYLNSDQGNGKEVFLLDARTGRIRRTLTHRAGVTSLAISPDSTTLAVGCEDGTVTLWRVK